MLRRCNVEAVQATTVCITACSKKCPAEHKGNLYNFRTGLILHGVVCRAVKELRCKLGRALSLFNEESAVCISATVSYI